MSPWDLPYVVFLAVALWSLLSDARGLGPFERALGFFGVGGLGAGEALFDLFAVAALFGLGFHALVESRLGALDPPRFLLGLSTALAVGVSAVWLRARWGSGRRR